MPDDVSWVLPSLSKQPVLPATRCFLPEIPAIPMDAASRKREVRPTVTPVNHWFGSPNNEGTSLVVSGISPKEYVVLLVNFKKALNSNRLKGMLIGLPFTAPTKSIKPT